MISQQLAIFSSEVSLTLTMSAVHVSRLTDRTLETLSPVRLLCIPAQLMQMKTPKLTEAHCGSTSAKKLISVGIFFVPAAKGWRLQVTHFCLHNLRRHRSLPPL